MAGAGPRFYRALDLSDALSISGTVFDVPSGNPLANAQVVLSFPDDPWPDVTNYTDAAGNYLLISTLLPEWGDYRLTVTMPGYPTWQLDDWFWGWHHLSIPVYLTAPGWVPPNDDFPGLVLTGTNMVVTGFNVGATNEPGEPFPGSWRSIWWTWTAPADGAVTIGAASSYDTTLAVFTGDDVSNLSSVAWCYYTVGEQESGVEPPG